ncbi:MAG: glycoside hydrolase family 2 TIM barrel-domain containing protein, partial [Oscillospiraceae bacterium]
METRVRFSLNKDWSFHYGDLPKKKYVSHSDIYGEAKAGAKQGPPSSMFDARSWRTIDIPHDYMIEQENDKNGAADWGYKPKGNAWYRKCFLIDEKYKRKRIVIEYEGVATEATVYFNGSVAKRNFSGYTAFSFDVTDRVKFGGAPNVLAVYVNGEAFEGWWYESAGIYRPVWLDILPEIRFAEEPQIVCNKLDNECWKVSVGGAITGKGAGNGSVSVKKIIKNADNEVIAEFDSSDTIIKNPILWDLDNPYLYSITSELYYNGVMSDSFTSSFGFRTISVDAEKGFFLNGKSIKLFGTCNHQDFAGIGTALTESIWRYKVARLKSMGCNAYRSAHGMASNTLVKICDEMGMLLMDENRNFETSEECLEQLRTMVKRDRNHPSVVFYSIFNEEPLQGTEQGRIMALHMLDEIRRLDSSRFVTGAMNGGILEDCGVGNALDVIGVNYQLYSYDDIHNKYPSLPIVGSETTSAFQTRSCIVTDKENHTFSCYDEDAADWGNNIRDTWREVDARDF